MSISPPVHPNVQVVQALYDAFGAGDVERARALVGDDFVWHEPPGHPWSGDHPGFEGLLAVNQAAGTAAGGTLAVEVHDILASDDHAVILQTVAATVDREVLHLQEILVAHVREGRLSEAWVAYVDPAPAARLFSRAPGR